MTPHTHHSPRRWARWLFWFLVLISCASLMLPACAKTCSKDSDCDNHFSCGSGYYCILRCFAGEAEGCIPGYVCDSTGTQCIQSTTTQEPTTTESTTPDASPAD